MPTTRRRRANPPEQAEQTAPVTASTEQASAPVENTEVEQKQTEATPAPAAESQHPVAGQGSTENDTPEAAQSVQSTQSTPVQAVPEAKTENVAPSAPVPTPPFRHTVRNHTARNAHTQFTPVTPPTTPVFPHDVAEHTNTPGTPLTPRPERLMRTERIERQQQQQSERQERPEYPPSIESGRRTARGELFRRPPQQPQSQPQPMPAPVAPPQLQPPSHEITLPLGNLLHLAYNPGYTGSEEARSQLLQKLAAESKAGGRARCWSCGSLAIAYDRWNTRSKTFGEVGVAFCEICGVWSVM